MPPALTSGTPARPGAAPSSRGDGWSVCFFAYYYNLTSTDLRSFSVPWLSVRMANSSRLILDFPCFNTEAPDLGSRQHSVPGKPAPPAHSEGRGGAWRPAGTDAPNLVLGSGVATDGRVCLCLSMSWKLERFHPPEGSSPRLVNADYRGPRAGLLPRTLLCAGQQTRTVNCAPRNRWRHWRGVLRIPERNASGCRPGAGLMSAPPPSRLPSTGAQDHA